MRQSAKPSAVVITLPKGLRRRADRVARRMRLSRDRFYAMALADYLARHEPDEVTERLNEVYAKDPAEPDPVLFALAMRAIEAEEW